MKITAKLLFSVLILTTSAAATAGDFNVYRFYASGSQWLVTYDNNLQTMTGHTDIYTGEVYAGEFTVNHDAAAEIVTITYSNGVIGGTCHVGNGYIGYAGKGLTPVYLQAVDLANNIDNLSKVLVSPYGGTGDGNQFCDAISSVEYKETVAFSCGNGYTYWGQSVYVVGNTPLLGQWNPEKAVKLNAANYPLWSANVDVEADSSIEWKCIKREEQNPAAGHQWENGSNNSFSTPTSASQAGQF